MTLKMKFKLLFSILFFLVSCTTSSKLYNKTPFNSSGFAYIYNDNDYENNFIKGKLDNTKVLSSWLEAIKITGIIASQIPASSSITIDFWSFSNKSFVAIKAKIFNEEKKLPSNAPVTSVEISNISKNKDFKKSQKKEEFFILIGSFSQKTVAEYLKNRIIKEIPNYNSKNLRIIKKSNTENNLLSGPYYTINLMKNDYILLKKFGFEELNIITND